MKPDHEAAKMVAERLESDPAYRVMVKPAKLGVVARAYLDAMARLDKATELLRHVAHWKNWGNHRHEFAALRVEIDAFLDERKTQ